MTRLDAVQLAVKVHGADAEDIGREFVYRPCPVVMADLGVAHDGDRLHRIPLPAVLATMRHLRGFAGVRAEVLTAVGGAGRSVSQADGFEPDARLLVCAEHPRRGSPRQSNPTGFSRAVLTAEALTRIHSAINVR